MPSIHELLENLGVDDATLEKNASAESPSCSDREIEKAAEAIGLISPDDTTTTKEASQQNGGNNMNLTDLYDAYFGEGEEKVASANFEMHDEYMEKDAAAELEFAGEQAGVVFSANLSDRLYKFAMDQAMESAATEDGDGSSATAVPGNTARSPQLAQNKPASAKAGLRMDLTPDADIMANGPLLDKAIAKATILKALASNDTDEVEGVSQVDLGLETPKSQRNA